MADSFMGELIACHECDKLHRYERIPAGSKRLVMVVVRFCTGISPTH